MIDGANVDAQGGNKSGNKPQRNRRNSIAGESGTNPHSDGQSGKRRKAAVMHRADYDSAALTN
jgi:hypothetical protein